MAENKELDYYQLLAVDYDASRAEIKAAYRRLRQQAAGDAGKQQLAIAYSVLSDPKCRQDYDKQPLIVLRRSQQAEGRLRTPRTGRPAEEVPGGGGHGGLDRTEILVAEAVKLPPEEARPTGRPSGAPPPAFDGDKTAIHVRAPVAVAILEILFPDGHRAKRPLQDGQTRIGRAERCDIVLPDPESFVSREHAVISVKSDRYSIRDDKSRNGTRVRGSEIRGKGDVSLSVGDEIEIEGRKLTLKLESEPG